MRACEARKMSSTGNMACKADERQSIEEQRSVVASAKLTLQERYRMANLRTAAMLFVVTSVFVITFLPASLISLYWLHVPVQTYSYLRL